MTNKLTKTNKFLPSTSSPNDEINIVQVQVLVPLLVHGRYGRRHMNHLATMTYLPPPLGSPVTNY